MQREIATQIDHTQSFAAGKKVYEQLVYMIVFFFEGGEFSNWKSRPQYPV
jgi:hypothetical protein